MNIEKVPPPLPTLLEELKIHKKLTADKPVNYDPEIFIRKLLL